MEIGGAGFGFFDEVGGEIKGGDLRAERGKTARGQAVSAGDVQVTAARLNVQKRSERRPARDVQDVYKKPYIFLLTSPRNLAFIKSTTAILH